MRAIKWVDPSFSYHNFITVYYHHICTYCSWDKFNGRHFADGILTISQHHWDNGLTSQTFISIIGDQDHWGIYASSGLNISTIIWYYSLTGCVSLTFTRMVPTWKIRRTSEAFWLSSWQIMTLGISLWRHKSEDHQSLLNTLVHRQNGYQGKRHVCLASRANFKCMEGNVWELKNGVVVVGGRVRRGWGGISTWRRVWSEHRV